MTIKQVKDDSMTITRKRYGRGYQYIDEKGCAITDQKLLRRLRQLVIPPMWTEVRICKWPDGHIQAIGRDAKSRKQYIYHSEWEKRRQEKKFEKMSLFGSQLASIRKQAELDLQLEKWCLSKVQALLILILDETGIRIGNQQYADRNGTYGLTTLRRKHLHLQNNEIVLTYQGKSHKQREVHIDDESLIQEIRKSAEQPGYELFRYREDNQWVAIDSDDVNTYIHKHMSTDMSSKDFRTWTATRLAVELYRDAVNAKEQYPRRKLTNILLRMVADELGNTPSVCRSYYVHPTIMQKLENEDIPMLVTDDERASWQLSTIEEYLLEVI